MGVATERRLAAIMLADIAGFSSLMERDESGTFDRVRDLREQLVTPKVAEHGGRIIKTTGDGFLAEFASATSALRCGVELQRANHANELARDENGRIHMRIGINVGDIIIDGDDIAGDGVIIASRLEPLAPLDGICVSGTVREHIRQDLGIKYLDLGDQQVKNISRPIRAYQIDLAGDGGFKVKRVNGGKQKLQVRTAMFGLLAILVLAIGLLSWQKGLFTFNRSEVKPYSEQDLRMSFAVLPLTAPDGDKAAAAFADAVTAAFIDRQANSPWARVVSRGSVDDALKKYASAKDLGRDLNVHFLLRGNVMRTGDSFTTTASIIDAQNDRVLGTQEFKWPTGKAVHGYSEAVNHTVGTLAAMGYRVELQRTEKKKPDELDVRDLSYLANHIWKNDKPSYDAVMPLLQRALLQAPDDRLALMLMVRVNLCECRNTWSKNPEEQEKIGAEALDKYLAKYGEDRSIVSYKYDLNNLHGRFEDSLAIVDRQLEKNSGDSRFLRFRAYSLFKLGKSKEALALIKDLMRQDPSRIDRSFLAALYYSLDQNAEAADSARKAAVELNKTELAHPASGGIRLIQAAADARLGHIQQARAALADFYSAVPNVQTISEIKKWLNRDFDLAGYEPFFVGLRKAGVPD